MAFTPCRPSVDRASLNDPFASLAGHGGDASKSASKCSTVAPNSSAAAAMSKSGILRPMLCHSRRKAGGSYGLQYVPVGVIWVPDRYLPNQRTIPSMTGDCWLRTVSTLQR